jgi:hypothetical protein
MADVLVRSVPTIPGGFRAVYPEDLPKWPAGVELMASVRLPRNIKMHRKAFAFLKALHPHVKDQYPTQEALRKALTIGSGYVDEAINPNTGEVHLQAKSWAFASLDEADFQKMYSAMVEMAISMVAGTDHADWELAVEELARF